MALISELVTKLTVDNSSLTTGLNNATNKFNKFGTSAAKGLSSLRSKILGLGAAFGIALTPIGIFYSLRKIGEEVDKITDSARGLGIAGEALQRLGYTAELSGQNLQDVEMFLTRANKSIGEAAQGNRQFIETFAKLNINVRDLKGQALDKQFLTIASALGKVTDKNIQAAIAAEIFGRNYTSVLSVVRDGIDDNIKGFDQLGLGINESQRKAIDAFGDAQTRIGAIFQSLGQKITAYTAGSFAGIIKSVEDIIKKMGGMDAVAAKFSAAILGAAKVAIQAIKAVSNVIDNFKISGLENQIENLQDTKNQNTFVSSGGFPLTDQQAQDFSGKNTQEGFSIVPAITAAITNNPINQQIKVLVDRINAQQIENNKTGELDKIQTLLEQQINTINKAAEVNLKVSVEPSPEFKITTYENGKKATRDVIAEMARQSGQRGIK